MKKLILCLFTALLLIILPVTGCKEAPAESTEAETVRTPVRNRDGRILLSEKEDLAFLRQYPGEDFVLQANIDCEGETWKPVEKFTGTLSGVWGGIFNYTVSNLVIEDADAENLGFFGISEGTVSAVNFKNITVKPEKGVKNCGAVFGIARGTVTDVMLCGVKMEGEAENANIGAFSGYQETKAEKVHADGVMNLRLSGSGSNAGGLMGIAAMASDCDSRVALTVEDAGEKNYIGGLFGTVSDCEKADFSGELAFRLSGGSSAAGEIAGRVLKQMKDADLASRKTEFTVGGKKKELPDAGLAEGARISGSMKRDLSTLDTLLPEAEQALRKTVVDYMHEEVTVPWTPVKNMEDTYTSGKGTHNYYPGQWYFGLPYTHKCGSLEKFMYYLNEDGTLKTEVPDRNYDLFIGNDCCDACYWAWAQIDGDLSYLQTQHMKLENGIIAVGWLDDSDTSTTNAIVANTGEKALYEAFSQLKAGDGILYGNPNGHARMISEAAYVFRKADGEIDPERSYVITMQQGGSKRPLTESHTTCGDGMKYTFKKLYETNYIPVTIPTFKKGEKDASTARLEKGTEGAEGVCKGKIVSNYRINWVYACITDETGAVVRSAIDFPTLNNHNVTYNLQTIRSKLDAKSLPAGTYHYRVSVNGGTEDVTVQEFTYTK